MPLETWWAFNKFWNNNFNYKVAYCCLYLLIHTTMHGSIIIKWRFTYNIHQIRSSNASYVQTARRRPFTAEDGFSFEPVHVRFVVDSMALRQVFSRVIWYIPVSIIPPNTTFIYMPLLPDGRGGKTFEKQVLI
jgi:hypothetical protein